MDRTLSFQELRNASASATLLFIHGACSSGSEWNLVTPHLSSIYHILLPDLPHHGASSEITPFTTDTAVSLLAKTIRSHAINSKAHIVGLSLGAHIAVALGSAHPDLAETVILSGYDKLASMSPETRARGLWLQSRIEAVIPRSWMRWAMDGTDFASIPSPSLQLCREIAAQSEASPEATKPFTARTLIVAAGKKDWLPTADNPDDAIALRDALMGAQQGKTKAVTHSQLRHPWNRQRPDLLAALVRAWIEHGAVMEEFNEL